MRSKRNVKKTRRHAAAAARVSEEKVTVYNGSNLVACSKTNGTEPALALAVDSEESRKHTTRNGPIEINQSQFAFRRQSSSWALALVSSASIPITECYLIVIEIRDNKTSGGVRSSAVDW
ncbi:hypothetical protein J6590_030992 [Homalodisca vitripennis]|nr:hypothetical protein J6590_030992 [Homalodisca vitripennis]